jgi:hypothetical protein
MAGQSIKTKEKVLVALYIQNEEVVADHYFLADQGKAARGASGVCTANGHCPGYLN